jgi:hypothetical protein
MKLGRRDVDLDHGHVGRRVRADNRRLDGLAVLEPDFDRGGAGDDVVVRDDVAGRVDDEARAFGRGSLVAEAARGRVDDDVDDARRDVAAADWAGTEATTVVGLLFEWPVEPA